MRNKKVRKERDKGRRERERERERDRERVEVTGGIITVMEMSKRERKGKRLKEYKNWKIKEEKKINDL